MLAPCQGTAVELEGSWAEALGRGMWWAGAYAAVGFARSRPPGHRSPSKTARCFGEKSDDPHPVGISYRRENPSQATSRYEIHGLRVGGGLQGGWRVLALDLGYLHNGALVINDYGQREKKETIHGLRGRIGLAFAHELFTGSQTTYSGQCCKLPDGSEDTSSETACECERTPIGLSLFLYYGNEFYFTDSDVWVDHVVGFSLKVGVGL